MVVSKNVKTVLEKEILLNPFAGTKIKVNGEIGRISGLLRARKCRSSATFVLDNVWNRYIIIGEDSVFSGVYSNELFFNSQFREISVDDLLIGRLRTVNLGTRRSALMPRVPIMKDKVAEEIIKPSRKKYITKNTPLKLKDWVMVKDTDVVGILVAMPHTTNLHHYTIIIISGDENNLGSYKSYPADEVERFKGKITIKA
jgi:hypothetical protein